ncbi:MAG: biopolymer transporter ExbD [Acaryochloridaceae cyanobacterium SU_2_1]|nr:biopolymer transporter ExbD [Acaryochloridaceae cyanobacterium SU_2_1]
MRFSKRQTPSQVPEINLVPMIDVLMSVLTFFIIVSMTLSGKQVLNITLPSSITKTAQEPTSKQPSDQLLVGLNLEGKLILDNQPTDEVTLAARIQKHLAQYPQGKIILSADRKLPYLKVAKTLKQMGKMGGNSASLTLRE